MLVLGVPVNIVRTLVYRLLSHPSIKAIYRKLLFPLYNRIDILYGKLAELERKYDALEGSVIDLSKRAQSGSLDIFGEDPSLFEFDPGLPLGYGEVYYANRIYNDAIKRALLYIQSAAVPGEVLEFGTYRGYTALRFALGIHKYAPSRSLHLFDSFTGFPPIASACDRESYHSDVWLAGAAAVEPEVPDRIRKSINTALPQLDLRIYKGYFSETLADIDANLRTALVHVDCDLYASTFEVLDYLLRNSHVEHGAVLMFDDFYCNRADPHMGERKALSDIEENYQQLTFTPFYSYSWHGQAFIIHFAN